MDMTFDAFYDFFRSKLLFLEHSEAFAELRCRSLICIYFKKAIIRTIKAMEKPKTMHYNDKRKQSQNRRERSD